MKASTLHALVTARAIYDSARRQAVSGDRHLCTAGLILLQDSLELIFLGLLRELGVDENISLESKSFDELIGQLKKANVNVPKSGTLKALNKQRVICKHYGQLAEPATVLTYIETAEAVLESIVPQVLGKTLQEVYLTDLIDDGESKKCLQSAAKNLAEENHLEALIDIRKALFIEIEQDYSVHGWKDDDSQNGGFGLLEFARGGHKAPHWTKKKDWIEKNVSSPVDYIQLDYEKFRIDAMEWGVHTEELRNLTRLTPDVFREKKDSEWHVQYDLQFPPNLANRENASYCLDRAIDIVLKKQQHTSARRWPSRDQSFDPPDIYIGSDVYSKASTQSEVVHVIDADFSYTIHRVVSGFDPSESFYYISGSKPKPGEKYEEYVRGYLLVIADDS